MPAAPTHTESTLAQNKALIQSYFDALSGKAKTAEILDRFVADPKLKEHVDQAESAFPAYEIVIDEMVAEGDTVAVRATFTGTHNGPLMGMPPSGKRVSSDVMLFYKIADEKIVDHSMLWNLASVMQQLQS